MSPRTGPAASRSAHSKRCSPRRPSGWASGCRLGRQKIAARPVGRTGQTTCSSSSFPRAASPSTWRARFSSAASPCWRCSSIVLMTLDPAGRERRHPRRAGQWRRRSCGIMWIAAPAADRRHIPALFGPPRHPHHARDDEPAQRDRLDEGGGPLRAPDPRAADRRGCLGIALLSFAFNERIVTHASAALSTPGRRSATARSPAATGLKTNVWVREGNNLVTAGIVAGRGNGVVLRQVEIFHRARQSPGRHRARAEAAIMIPAAKAWVLEDAKLFDVNTGTSRALGTIHNGNGIRPRSVHARQGGP
jgi:hypothetical protein